MGSVNIACSDVVVIVLGFISGFNAIDVLAGSEEKALQYPTKAVRPRRSSNALELHKSIVSPFFCFSFNVRDVWSSYFHALREARDHVLL